MLERLAGLLGNCHASRGAVKLVVQGNIGVEVCLVRLEATSQRRRTNAGREGRSVSEEGEESK
jgi:hypothetical protein